MITAGNSADNFGQVQGPPLSYCPYCYTFGGRGIVPLIPTLDSPTIVIWRCKNSNICPFPYFYGLEAVDRLTVPRHMVSSALIGYIPVQENESTQHRRSNHFEAEAVHVTSQVTSSTSSNLSQRPASIISHWSTSSNATDHDPNLLTATSNLAHQSVANAPVAADLITFQEPDFDSFMNSMDMPYDITPSSSTVTPASAPIFTSPTVATSTKPSFPSYVLESAPRGIPLSVSATGLPQSNTYDQSLTIQKSSSQLKPKPSSSSYSSVVFGNKEKNKASLAVISNPGQSRVSKNSFSSNPRKRPLRAVDAADRSLFPAYVSEVVATDTTATTTVTAEGKNQEAVVDVMNLFMKKLKQVKKNPI